MTGWCFLGIVTRFCHRQSTHVGTLISWAAAIVAIFYSCSWNKYNRIVAATGLTLIVLVPYTLGVLWRPVKKHIISRLWIELEVDNHHFDLSRRLRDGTHVEACVELLKGRLPGSLVDEIAAELSSGLAKRLSKHGS